MKSAAFIWKHLKGMRVRYVAAHIISVITATFVIVNPYLSKILIDDCIQGERRDLFIPLIAVMCITVFLQSTLKMIRINFLEAPSQHLLISIRKTVFSRIQNQDKDFFDDIGSGDIINRVTGDLEYLRHFTAWVVYHMVETIVMFTVSVAMLMFISTELTLMLLAVMPILLLTSKAYSKKVRPTFMEIRKQLSKLNGAAQENIDANRVVKAFVREEYETEKFSERSLEFKKQSLNAAYMWIKIIPVLNFLAESLSIITIIAGGLLAINGRLTLGDLTLFTSLTWALAMPIRNISMLLNDFQRFSTSCEKIIEICEYPQKIKDSDDAVDEENLTGIIEFKNVSFSFGRNKILDNVSFEINPGETVVVMGPTGCGKTTLINLMLRFYDVDDGEVLLDGIDIRKRTLKSVRGTMAVATQQVFLFSDTIDGNIAFSDVSMSEEKVKKCAEYACADEFVERMPENYDTIIGERGVGLSGGQRQRIALARALAAEPKVLILDDTTSAVDADTEMKIQKTLDSLPYSATKIVVAQRISATRNADKIFILENGGITVGTHADLYSNNSYYRSICELQDVSM